MLTKPATRACARSRAWHFKCPRFFRMNRKWFFAAALASASIMEVQPASAAANLILKHITWDVIGLDSNMASTDGPDDFPVAVRVKNTGPDTALNVNVALKLSPTGNQHISINGVSNITTPSLAPNQIADFYFQVKIARPPGNNQNDTDGYFSELADPDTVRKYWFEATATNAPLVNSVAENRQLYVEKILSQNRNSVAPVLVLDDPMLPFVPGQIRTFTLYSDTATGYDQQETGINFPTNFLQVQSVYALYTDPACTCQIQNQYLFHQVLPLSPGKYATNKIYVDACAWITDPTEPGYMLSNGSCTNDSSLQETTTGKVGGTIVTVFKVKVVAPITEQIILSYLVHDHSGSSFHYNFEANIFEINPTNILVGKTAPALPIEAGSDFSYMITVRNDSNAPADDVVLSDTLPSCVTVKSSSPSPVNLNANPLVWNLGTLDPNETVQFEVVATAGCTKGQCINTATVATTDLETDYADNVSTAQITVVDTVPPTIQCPGDKTLQCPGDTSVQTNGTPTYSDKCGATIANVDTTSATCGNTFVLKRVWTATDSNGNKSSCTQTLTVIDTTKPTISDLPDATVECPASTAPTGQPTASDTCGSVAITYTDGPMSDGCGNTGVFTRTWKATDQCGNFATSEQIITVEDKTKPTISDLQDTKVECTATTAPTIQPTASDTCGSVVITFTDGPMSDGCGNTGVFTRTWKATDQCGNFATSEQLITIEDKTKPTISDLQDTKVECTATTAPTIQPTASDTCGSVVITFTDGPMSDGCGNTGVFTRTWKATDQCGNFATSEQLITIEDKTKPTISDLQDIKVECTGSTAPTVQPTASDTCGTVAITYTDGPMSDGCGNTGVFTRTWKATDQCGNFATSEQVITIEDKTKPTISDLQDTKVECTASTAPTVQPTASDTCGSVAITYTDGPMSDGCGNTGVFTRTWKATDQCGNFATSEQVITIEDKTKPTISDLQDTKVECTASTAPTVQPTASDTCGTVAITYTDGPMSDGCGNTGAFTRTWKATDQCGNFATSEQLITIEDKTKPTISDLQDIKVECTGSTAPTVQPTASDTCGTVAITYTDGPMSDGCGNTGSFTRTWKATDQCGNFATSEQVITIEDKTKPTISDLTDAKVECTGSTAPTVQPTASDTCGTVAITYTDGPMSDGCGNTGSFTRTWKATDQCGNFATSEQVITIEDKTKPTISDLPDTKVECTASTAPTTQPTASDTCGKVTVTYTDGPMSDGCGNTGSFTRTWKATDECGNFATSEQLITIEDKTPPTINCPNNIVASAPTAPATCTVVNYPPATATDTCGKVTITYNPPSGTCFECGTTSEVVVTATDECGNHSRCTFTVTVEECRKPTCGFTQGYWKNHPGAWPVNSLYLGSRSYSKYELLKILQQPVKGNGLISLAHQLIAAKLNIANGSDDDCIAATILQADALINGKDVPPIGKKDSLSTKLTATLTATLDAYNNGYLCIGHCDDLEPLPAASITLPKGKSKN